MGRAWILDYDSANCAIGATVGIIGERPTFLVLREAFNGVRRFADMQRRTGMPRQVLSDRLARLVGEGLLRKVPYQESGQRVRYEYRLTEQGPGPVPGAGGADGVGRPARGRPGRPAGPAASTATAGSRSSCSWPARAGHVLGSAREVTPVPGPGARKIA